MTSTLKAPRKTSAKNPQATRSSAPNAPGTIVVARGSEPIEGLTLGGPPRVHLMPPQVLARKKGKKLRRRLGLGVVVVIVVVAAGLGLATVALASSQASLLDAQNDTSSILQQQAKYGDVLKVKADASAIQSSQLTATAQEIAWQPFISNFEKTMPTGASITTLTATLDNPFGGSAGSAAVVPLQGPHVATITGTLSMQQSTISGWLDSLPALKGFVDVTPNSVTSAQGSYVVAFTMHVNKDAFANRFAKDSGETK